MAHTSSEGLSSSFTKKFAATSSRYTQSGVVPFALSATLLDIRDGAGDEHQCLCEMLLDGGDGNLHLFRYFADRAFMHAAQDEYTHALWRQGFYCALDLTEFVARRNRGFGRAIRLRFVEVCDAVKPGDRIAPRRIDDYIARDPEQIMTTVAYLGPVVTAIGPDQGFRDEIVEVEFGNRAFSQARAQGPLMRQDM